MKKTTIISLVVSVALIAAAGALARPAKDPYDGKTSGNNGFTNFVDSGGMSLPSGWVKYHKEGECLDTNWVVKDLSPNTEYQLKLHSKEGDEGIGNACGAPNEGAVWQCGLWGGESFLVLDTVMSDENGHIGYSGEDCRLPVGEYEDAQFIITQNSAPWGSAWTWENSPDSDDAEPLCNIGTIEVPIYVDGDPWCGDISTFEITNASVDLCYKTADGVDLTPDTPDDWQCWPEDAGDGHIEYARANNGEGVHLTASGLAPNTWFFVEVAEKDAACSWLGQTNSGDDAQYYVMTNGDGMIDATFDTALTDYTEFNVKNADWYNDGSWHYQGNGWDYVLYAEQTTPMECGL